MTGRDARAEREQARLASLEGNYDEAYRLYEQLLTIEPDDADTLLDYARAKCREFEDLEGATRLFERLADVRPGSAEVQLWLGDLYSLGYGRGYRAAADRYREALRLDPRAADAYIGLGMLHRVPSAPVTLAEAIDAFARAVELDPRRADARADLGMALLESGRRDAARRELALAERPLNQAGEARQANGVRGLIEALGRRPGSEGRRILEPLAALFWPQAS